jgi:large subunit ribosomal protein L21
MHAVIETGGRQYRVTEGDVIDVQLLGQEDGEVSFDRVKLVESEDAVKVGAPDVDGATVAGTVLGTVKGRKVVGVSFRRRKGSKKTKGHRQKFSRVKITGINA